MAQRDQRAHEARAAVGHTRHALQQQRVVGRVLACAPLLAIAVAADRRGVVRRYHARRRRPARRRTGPSRRRSPRRPTAAQRGAPWPARSRRRSPCGSSASAMPSVPCATRSTGKPANRLCSSISFLALFDASTRRITPDPKPCVCAAQQLADALVGQREQRVHLARARRLAPSAVPCTSTKPPRAGHHHVHVGVAGRVFDVVEVEQRRALHDADRHRGDLVAQRRARRSRRLRQQPASPHRAAAT